VVEWWAEMDIIGVDEVIEDEDRGAWVVWIIGYCE
jgi:hypothetical protein